MIITWYVRDAAVQMTSKTRRNQRATTATGIRSGLADHLLSNFDTLCILFSGWRPDDLTDICGAVKPGLAMQNFEQD